MKTCVLIPTYNESKTIAELVKQIRAEHLDCLVIDDGSMDKTAEIARSSGAAIIIHKENRGKGASLKSGFNYALEAGYEAVVVLDGDGQHNPRDVRRFIDTAMKTGADIIVGNRMGNPRSMPFIRRATNICLSSFISKMCGQLIPDTQCGFRLIRSNVLKSIKLISSKFDTESEMLIRAGKDFKIISIPIKSIYNNEVSSINPLKDPFRFMRLIIRIRREMKKGKA